ncbi:Holliday junction resolvase RuvX [Candidatus Cloacimonadaceae bacterium]
MSLQGRILAIDYGEKRIGLAISDPLRIFAKPLLVLANNGYKAILQDLSQIIAENQISMILIGIPLAIEGNDTPKTTECRQFMEMLSRDISLPISGIDERYSSQEAEAELKKLGYTWQEARKIQDAMAACLFLKEYLNSL